MGCRQKLDTRIHILPENSSFIFATDVCNPNNLNSAIELCIQVGSISNPKLRVFTNLLEQIIKEPFFNQLRTTEQLGYIVHSGTKKQTEMISYRFIIQSEMNPVFLESRIEQFLLDFKDKLYHMSDHLFEKNKKSFVYKMLEKHKNMKQQSSFLWRHICSGYYDFQQKENDADLVVGLSKKEFIDFYENHIIPGAPSRRKVSVHLKSQNSSGPDVVLDNAEIIDKLRLSDFKNSLPLTNHPSPVQTIGSYLLDNIK